MRNNTVYILFKNASVTNNEEKRKLYVALTRTKESLYIHCNTNVFSQYFVDGVIKTDDMTEYNEPSEISLQLSHKDVVLSYFMDKKEIILNLRSGCNLEISDSFLSAEVKGRTVRVAKFSKAFSEKLEKLKNKGYEPVGANIAYIVAWQGEEDENESAIILPIVRFVFS